MNHSSDNCSKNHGKSFNPVNPGSDNRRSWFNSILPIRIRVFVFVQSQPLPKDLRMFFCLFFSFCRILFIPSAQSERQAND